MKYFQMEIFQIYNVSNKTKSKYKYCIIKYSSIITTYKTVCI